MTNREKLLNTNIYDLLVSIQDNIFQCVLEAIEGHSIPCAYDIDCCSQDANCKKCIQEYLNKEV